MKNIKFTKSLALLFILLFVFSTGCFGDDNDEPTSIPHRFVAVGWNGRIMTSPNGATWTDETVPGDYFFENADTFYGVTYGEW